MQHNNNQLFEIMVIYFYYLLKLLLFTRVDLFYMWKWFPTCRNCSSLIPIYICLTPSNLIRLYRSYSWHFLVHVYLYVISLCSQIATMYWPPHSQPKLISLQTLFLLFEYKFKHIQIELIQKLPFQQSLWPTEDIFHIPIL